MARCGLLVVYGIGLQDGDIKRQLQTGSKHSTDGESLFRGRVTLSRCIGLQENRQGRVAPVR